MDYNQFSYTVVDSTVGLHLGFLYRPKSILSYLCDGRLMMIFNDILWSTRLILGFSFAISDFAIDIIDYFTLSKPYSYSFLEYVLVSRKPCHNTDYCC